MEGGRKTEKELAWKLSVRHQWLPLDSDNIIHVFHLALLDDLELWTPMTHLWFMPLTWFDRFRTLIWVLWLTLAQLLILKMLWHTLVILSFTDANSNLHWHGVCRSWIDTLLKNAYGHLQCGCVSKDVEDYEMLWHRVMTRRSLKALRSAPSFNSK